MNLNHFESAITAPTYVTGDVPGTGGRIKAYPQDFLVEEIPLYNPSGEGEHIYLLVEKREMTTMQLRDALAKHFGVHRKHIGYAGLKDRDAIARQLISIHTPGKTPEDFPSFQHDRASVLWADLHTNKLARGHLSGNRFSIKVRDVDPLQVRQAKRSLDILAQTGVPNRFGEQRFGNLQNNHHIGRSLILGDAQSTLDLMLSPNPLAPTNSADARQAYADGRYRNGQELMPKVYKLEYRLLKALADGQTPQEAMRVIDQTSAGFFISAYQSALFNQTLNSRIKADTLNTLLAGDLAITRKKQTVFEVIADELNDPDHEIHNRCAQFEISPSGPMWGTSMPQTKEEIYKTEFDILNASGVSLEDFASCEKRTQYPMLGGQRRSLRVQLIDPEVEGGIDEHGAYIRCGFELPSGAFATNVMDEIMKLNSPTSTTTA